MALSAEVSCLNSTLRSAAFESGLRLRSVRQSAKSSQFRGTQRLIVRSEQSDTDVDVRATPKFTGFVEKDTAGQTNIYAVEPTVYVAESAISTNSQGSSSEGSGGTVIISAFLALAAISGAAAVLFTVSSKAPQVTEEAYSGPPLTFYIQKFQTPEVYEEAPAAPELVDAPVFEIVIIEEIETPSAPEAAPEVVPDVSPAVVAEDVAPVVAEDVPAAATEDVPAVVTEDAPVVVEEDAPAAPLENVADVVVEEAPVIAESVPAEVSETKEEIVVEAKEEVGAVTVEESNEPVVEAAAEA